MRSLLILPQFEACLYELSKILRAPSETLFNQLVGDYRGPSRIWLNPDAAPEEILEEGSLEMILEGRFALYRYRGGVRGSQREGQYIFGYNSNLERFEASWLDSFHNDSAMMFSTGQPKSRGFSVRGRYPDPSGGPDWGWRTEVEFTDSDQWQIVSYNISPSGMEARAAESSLSRVAKSS